MDARKIITVTLALTLTLTLAGRWWDGNHGVGAADVLSWVRNLTNRSGRSRQDNLSPRGRRKQRLHPPRLHPPHQDWAAWIFSWIPPIFLTFFPHLLKGCRTVPKIPVTQVSQRTERKRKPWIRSGHRIGPLIDELREVLLPDARLLARDWIILHCNLSGLRVIIQAHCGKQGRVLNQNQQLVMGRTASWTTVIFWKLCFAQSISARCSHTGLLYVQVGRSGVPRVRKASRRICNNSKQNTTPGRRTYLWVVSSHLKRKGNWGTDSYMCCINKSKLNNQVLHRVICTYLSKEIKKKK